MDGKMASNRELLKIMVNNVNVGFRGVAAIAPPRSTPGLCSL